MYPTAERGECALSGGRGGDDDGSGNGDVGKSGDVLTLLREE